MRGGEGGRWSLDHLKFRQLLCRFWKGVCLVFGGPYFLVFWLLAGSFCVNWIIRSKLSSGADLLGIILPHFVHLWWIIQPFFVSWVAEMGCIRDLQVLLRSPGVDSSTCCECRHLRQ